MGRQQIYPGQRALPFLVNAVSLVASPRQWPAHTLDFGSASLPLLKLGGLLDLYWIRWQDDISIHNCAISEIDRLVALRCFLGQYHWLSAGDTGRHGTRQAGWLGLKGSIRDHGGSIARSIG